MTKTKLNQLADKLANSKQYADVAAAIRGMPFDEEGPLSLTAARGVANQIVKRLDPTAANRTDAVVETLAAAIWNLDGRVSC
jgi:uncharacterized protein (DUF2342 family)